MKRIICAPSILSADFSRLDDALALIDASGAPWVHLDVMDGRFVPALTFGPKTVADLRPLSGGLFDVHLMVVEPERLVPSFIESGADAVTFHLEACVHAHRLIQEIKAAGKLAGISIVPSTPVSALESLLPSVDLVLVMTVNPGFGGQKIIPECVSKVAALDRIRESRGFGFRISVDGGVNRLTARGVVEAGTDIVVAGSAFFNEQHPADLVKFLETGA